MNNLIVLKKLSSEIANLQFLDEVGRNSFSENFIKELLHKMTVLSSEKKIKVVILSGLSSVFSSGADLATLRQLAKKKIQPTDITLPRVFLNFPVPLIAAMEGHAIGGGLALGLCADVVILAEESRYGCSFMNMGFTPGMGITRLLEFYMSAAMAHELQYTGAFKQGKELIGKTNFNYILPKKEVMPTAIDLAERIAEKPLQSLKILKQSLAMEKRKMFEYTFSVESMMHAVCFNDDEILNKMEENYVR